MKKALLNLIFLAGVYTMIFPPKAHAYLDPGTGSYLLQVVAAVFFAGIFAVKTWWSEIKRIITGLFSRKGVESVEKRKKD